MEVVLRCADTLTRERRDLEEVDDATKRDLGEVQHEDRDTPLLVRVVKVRRALLVHGLNSAGHAGDDDWQSWRYGKCWAHMRVKDRGAYPDTIELSSAGGTTPG